jgi:hypothetical protein
VLLTQLAEFRFTSRVPRQKIKLTQADGILHRYNMPSRTAMI